MEKEFYTYEKILLSLYKEYLNNQKLLNELKQYISIDDDKIKDFYFKSYLKYVKRNKIINDKRIQLVVEQKLNKLKKLEENLLFLNGYSKDNHSIYYDIVNDDKVSLNINHKDKLANINPKIELTNPLLFSKLVKEILNTKFMNLEEYTTDNSMIDNWHLFINSSNLTLKNNSKSVNYNPHDNTINLHGISSGNEFYSIIRGNIPKCYLNLDMIDFIDENISNKCFELNDYEFDYETTLNISDGKVLRLNKKAKKFEFR